MNEYQRRDNFLQSIGFSSYSDYLKSDLWKSLRLRAMQRDGYSCIACGGRATEVHHRGYGYATLSGKTIQSLFCVCRECHSTLEFDGTRKRPIREVRRVLKRITAEKEKRRRRHAAQMILDQRRSGGTIARQEAGSAEPTANPSEVTRNVVRRAELRTGKTS